MDYEAALISTAILEDKVGDVVDMNVLDEFFVSHKDVWDFVKGVYKEHGKSPPVEMLAQYYPEFNLKKTEVPISLAVQELRKRHVHNSMRNSLRLIARIMEKGDPMKAFDIMKSTVVDMDVGDSLSRDINLAVRPLSRIDEYHEVAKCEGMIGIPTPWRLLNEATQGFQPEDLIMLAGRGGVGKSWGEVVLACTQWQMGYLPLLISNEMSVKQIVRRVDATNAKLPYTRFRAGMLSGEELERWERALRDMEGGLPFWVSGDRTHLSVTGIKAKIRKYRPNIVWIDGGYLLYDETGGKAKWERWSNVCEGLKRVAQDEGIPIGLSHQFNLEGKKDMGTADTLKYGDVQMWFDVIVGMYRSEDLQVSKEMLFKMLKIREGEGSGEWVSGWDLDHMEFPDKGHSADDLGYSDESDIMDAQIEY